MNASITVVSAIIAVSLALLILSFMGRKTDKKKPKKKKKKDRATIIREATKRLAQNPRDPDGLLAMGNLYFLEQDWEHAYGVYEILITLAPSHSKIDVFESALRLGISAVKTNRIQEAVKSFVQARNLQANHFEVNYNLGYICYLQKDYDKAIPYLRQALMVETESILALRYMGFSLHKAHRSREAPSYLKKPIELQPSLPWRSASMNPELQNVHLRYSCT